MSRRIVSIVVALVLLSASAIAAPTYSYVTQWGAFGSGDGDFFGPAGIALGPDGLLYVADAANHRIQVFTTGGTYIRKWGTFGSGNTDLNSPQGLAVGADGYVYVADSMNDRVVKYTATGVYVTQWGGSGSGNGQFNFPMDVATDREGNVYVADALNDRIQKFSDTGTYFAQFGSFGTGNGQFSTPDSIVVDDAFRVYVTDRLNNRVQVLQDYGNWFAYVDQWGVSGTFSSQFDAPHGIALDPDSRVFVADADNDRIQKFEADGDYLVAWGGLGMGNGQFDYPTGVAAGPARDVYVSDTVNNRIQTFFSAVPTRHTRVEGADRYLTAVAASQEAFPDGTRTFEAVIATGQNWPDALGGSALAGAVGGPLLLTRTDSLPTEVRDELVRLQIDHVYILGGEGVVSKDVADAISALPFMTVERLAGPTRYGTANAVAVRTAQKLGSDYDGGAFVATGLNFPDALAASPLAARKGWPIFLAPPSGLSNETRAAMGTVGVTDVHLLGGRGVVSLDIESEMQGRFGSSNVMRLEGPTRYETAIAVARYGVDVAGLEWSHTGLATGRNFPDGLAGGVLAGRMDSVLLLTRGETLEANVRDRLTTEKAEVYEVYYLGGTAAVSGSVQNSLGGVLY